MYVFLNFMVAKSMRGREREIERGRERERNILTNSINREE
jgi:hypothetical protein